MVRAIDVTKLVEVYPGPEDFIKLVQSLDFSLEQQPRYKIGWTQLDIDLFTRDFGRERSGMMQVGLIGTEEISYYSYIYRPDNKLILIYEVD
jgi:hypothetical protein